MSLSSGPLTAPLATMRGVTEAGSMTRIRYVSRVPGPWRAASATRTLVNDDSPTRFLKRDTAARPTPLAVGDPPSDDTGAQRDHDPEGERAGAAPARRQMFGERRALDQREFAIQLRIDLCEPLLVRDIRSRHQTSS